MQWRMHGANPDKLYKQFNMEMPEKIIDYTDNSNVVQIEEHLDIDFTKYFDNYPDDEVLELREIIAARENTSIDNVLFVNGTNEVIYIIASYYQNKTVAVFHPTYSEYEKALNAYDVAVEHIFNFNDVKTDYSAIIICNPNNPTGRYFDFVTMNNFAKKLSSMNIDLIIDEAYIDFMYIKHQTLDIEKLANIYILRSLTKFYHLSGLRIGYLLTNQNNIEKIKKRQPTWSVNSIAQIVAIKYLKNISFVQRTKSYYEEERRRLILELNNLGFEVEDSYVNFLVMKVNDDEDLIKFLLTKGLVVRHTRNFPGLDGKYIRITIKTVKENNLLLDALADYIKNS